MVSWRIIIIIISIISSIIVDERGNEVFAYGKLPPILLLLLVNVEAQCFLTEN